MGDNDGLSLVSECVTVGDNDGLLDGVTVENMDGLSDGVTVRLTMDYQMV